MRKGIYVGNTLLKLEWFKHWLLIATGIFTRKYKCVVKKYSECFNLLRFITVRDTVSAIPLKIPSLTLDTLIPPFLKLSEAVLEVLFLSVFSCIM